MKKKPDFLLLTIMTLLLVLGVLMIYSASSPECAVSASYNRQPWHFAIRQCASIAIGIIVFWFCQWIDLKKLEKLSPLCFPIALVLVCLLEIPGLGVTINGSTRWIGAGLFMIQPAEFAKVLCIIGIAGFLAKHKDKIKESGINFQTFISNITHELKLSKFLFNLWNNIPPYWRLCAIVLIISFIIEQEPDLGTAASIFFIYIIMVVSGGADIKVTSGVMGFAGAAVLVYVLHKGLNHYRVKRILAFINPWQDEQGWGYQNCQGLIAVGSGGLTGLGFGESRQKFFYLPERHTDFIFAVISEELGLIGGLLILIAFTLIFYRGFKIASETNDLFFRMLAVGCASMLSIQAAMNIAVVIGAMPTTGIPLPFISYGGSSILASMAIMGLLFNVSKYTSEKGRCWELSSENELQEEEYKAEQNKKAKQLAEKQKQEEKQTQTNQDKDINKESDE